MLLEEIIDRGITAADELKKSQFALGDLANAAKDEYGMCHSEYAKAIGADAGTLQEYARVCRYYGRSVYVVEVLRDNPLLTWTHFREAMRVGDFQKSIDLLEHAIDERMSSGIFRGYVDSILGGKEFVYKTVVYDSTEDSHEPLAIMARVKAQLIDAAARGVLVQVKVYEVQAQHTAAECVG